MASAAAQPSPKDSPSAQPAAHPPATADAVPAYAANPLNEPPQPLSPAAQEQPPPPPPPAAPADLQFSTDHASACKAAQQAGGSPQEAAACGQRVAAPQQPAPATDSARLAGAASAKEPTSRRPTRKKPSRKKPSKRKPTKLPALLDPWRDPVRNRSPTEDRHGAPLGQTVNWAVVDQIINREKRRYGAYGAVAKLPQRVLISNAISAADAKVRLGPELLAVPCFSLKYDVLQWVMVM